MSTARTLGRLLPLLVLAGCLMALVQAFGRLVDAPAWSSAGSDPAQAVFVLAAGVALLGCGALAITVSVQSRAGVFAFLAGLAWLGPELARLAAGVPPLRSAAVAAGLLVMPLLLHLVLAYRPPWHPGPAVRSAIAVVDVAAAVAAVAAFLTYAPFYDPRCPEACNFLTAIVDLRLAERMAVADVGRLVTLGSGTMLAIVAMVGLLAASGRSLPRSVLLLGALATGVGGAGHALAQRDLVANRTGDLLDNGTWLALALLCLGLLTMAVGLALAVIRFLRVGYRLRAITESLVIAANLGPLESELAQALDDAALRVGYPVAEDGPLVDGDGAPRDLGPAPGRTVTPLTRDGVVLALVDHGHDVDQRVLTDALRPSLLVALDNERLRALRLARLRDLRASRARIVELADAERRRVERDLHDGAQQGLLAAAIDLRLARVTAEREGRTEAAILHGHAEAIVLSVVDDLRRLCRGIHPQVLSQAGLGPALASLADESEIPLEVSLAMTERAPMAVETAAYEVIRDALAQAASTGSDALAVSVRRVAAGLVVEATGGSLDHFEVRQRVDDRAGAVGGSLVAGRDDRGAFIRAELPCA